MNGGTYHLISVGGVLVLSYLVSLVAVRKQFISRQNHRKFWNTLLLLFFTSTALLGLLLAVKVNYKLKIPWAESALQWHVDLGIGYALVAIFHLLRHLRYYTGHSKASTGSNASSATGSPGARWTPHLSITPLLEKSFFLLLGYVSILAQLVLLREFVKTFHGNELVIGIFLSLWMVFTATGAQAGVRSRVKITFSTLLRTMLTLGTMPLLIYLILILVTRFLFLPGFEPGMGISVVVMVLLTGPFALASGFLFAYVSRSVKSGKTDDTYYRLDSLGSLLAGFLFGLVLVFFLDNVQVLGFLFMTTALVLVLVFRFPGGKPGRSLLLLAGSLLYVLLLIPSVRSTLEGWRYRGEELMESRDTPFGNLAFTEKDGQYTVYLDRNPVFGPDDVVGAEEQVHYAALQHAGPTSFLLIGGGVSGALSEVVKYAPGRIDYCEADPWIFRMGKQYLSDSLPGNLSIISSDGRNWLKKSDTTGYDVIISAAGDPVTIGWNRFFTREFYQLVSKRLNPGGIFCMQLSTGGNYINEQGSELLAINYHTLKESFTHVLLVPGQSTWFLASSNSLSLDFPALLEEHQIETHYVHPDYMDVMRLSFDSDQLMERIMEEAVAINTDLRPRLFFSRLSGLESINKTHSMVISGILGALLFLILLFTYPPLKSGMFVTGFTGAGVQILLIVVMQSLFGYAYLVTPIMITLFMAGIVLGSQFWRRAWHTPSLRKLTTLVWIMALLTVAVVLLLKWERLLSDRFPGQLFLGLFNFMPGVIVGSVYGMSVSLTGKNERAGSIGLMYGADLTGAALGCFVPVVFLLPLIGVTNTFILFCGINVATGLYLLLKATKYQKDG